MHPVLRPRRGLALAGLLGPRAIADGETPADGQGQGQGPWRGIVNPPHLPVKAKRIIHLCMAGGPSQFESFDWKPELKRLDTQPFPESFTKGQQLAQPMARVGRPRGERGHRRIQPLSWPWSSSQVNNSVPARSRCSSGRS